MFLLLLVLTSADTARTVQIPVAPGESLTVMMVGEGAPVVLLPGLFGSLYSYRYVMARLDSAGYGSFAIEPLGMGTSSRPFGLGSTMGRLIRTISQRRPHLRWKA